MKKFTLFLIGFAFALSVNAQQWTKNLPSEKTSSTYSFYDYQNAFYTYWEPFNIKRGYYIDENGREIKASGWKQFKRWEYFWETRIDSQTGDFLSRDINSIFKQEKGAAVFKNSGELWLSQGPKSSNGGYEGIGRINTIAYHPADSNMFWAGTASGGLWVTTDGGQNWSVLNDDMQAIGVSDIVIPSDFETSQTIYLATGDRDAYDTRSIGLLKSIDAGANWESLELDFNTDQGEIINRVLINPIDNSTMIVAGSFGVKKSYNSKLKSYQEVMAWANISSEIFIDMEFKPGDFSTLYGSTKRGGVFVSSDSGDNWLQTLDEADGYRIELAVSPAEPTWVYAIVVNDIDGLFGIYKSLDSGTSFTQIFDGSVSGNNLLGWENGNDNDEGGQGWYDLAIAASPTDANTVLIGGINTWLSNDGGVSWEMVNHWYGGYATPAVHADKHYLGYQLTTGNLFEGNDGGIYKTNDYENWTDLSNGIVNSQIYRLGISATQPEETISGLQDNGTKLFNIEGDWMDVKSGDGMECIIDFTNVNIQYGSYVNGQISKTTDRWITDSDISARIPGDLEGAWVTPYIINPIDPLKLYVGYAELWKTENGGGTFSQISDFQGSELISLAISPSDTSTLYAATHTKIHHTFDGGLNWTDITGNLPVGSVSINYIAVKNDDPNTVWVTISGYSGYGVFESTNAGQNWTNIAEGLPDVPCNTIVQNKLNLNQVELYVGTDIGVYLKLGNDNWVYYSTGLPNVVVSELEIYYDSVNPKDSKIKAATYGRGLWVANIYDSGIQTGIESPTKIAESIYPNPSNGEFELVFSNYNGEEIDVEIRSLSGKLVYKNSFSNPSNSINVKYLADGVYVLQIKRRERWFGQNIVIQK
ncbi:MAG: T9SS type A sorting domain-containing protein [Bacteroidales bacterium]|jgi:photosystem II stability/assembly factor-like uncharacterized protein|nr:T9SS type A sorting domain-containing protein [Bacteroidales bacterium]